MNVRIRTGWLMAVWAAVVALPAVCLGQFETQNIEFLSRVPLSQMGGGDGSDLWGWTDSTTGREYALFGRSNGTSFVDVTNPSNPVYLGNLPSFTGSSTWRDIKTYDDHAYIVSDSNGPHGLQIFDLTNLRGVQSPQTFSETAHFDGLPGSQFRSAHNIAINEDSGYAYITGSNRASGGLYILDLSNPTSPTVAGQYSGDGYTHDAQIVNYLGPDPDYQGREVAFAFNEDTVTIVDVTNKNSPSLIDRAGYPEAGYTHQGWVSEDQRYLFVNDEFDEFQQGGPTRTHIFNIENLDQPQYVGFHTGATNSVDHNLYVKGNLIYEANYSSGLRVLEITDAQNGVLTEVGFLDTYPADNNASFDGAWSVYPYFDSGTIIVSDIYRGLFVARLDLPVTADFNGDGTLDCADIDDLIGAIAAQTNDPAFDLTGDGQVSLADRDQWLADAGAVNLGAGLAYLAGDANLDGVVDGQDFLAWNANKFTSRPEWCLGDFNADGAVDGQDFIEWNGNKFQASTDATLFVPEPSVTSLVGLMLLATLGLYRSSGAPDYCGGIG